MQWQCDECHPVCRNCIKHGVNCSYSSAPLVKQAESPSSSKPEQRSASVSSYHNSNSNSSPETIMVDPAICTQSTPHPTSQSLPSPTIQLNMAHIELMHNYSTASYLTLSRNPVLQTVWRVQVPQIGLEVDYVMCAILAFSSLHLAFFKPDQRDFYTNQALALHSTALRSVSAILPNVTDSNCAALWTFAALNCSFSFAQPNKTGDLLFTGEDGMAEWLLVFRGVRIILESTGGRLFNTPLAPIFNAGLRRELARENNPSPPTHPDLTDLLDRITESVPATQLAIYSVAIAELSKSFYQIQNASLNNSEINSTDALIWLFTVSDSYLDLLSKRTPEALVVFAYYCTVLKGLEWAWWMTGWSFNLMARTYTLLDHTHRVWLQWPIEQIGWLPP